MWEGKYGLEVGVEWHGRVQVGLGWALGPVKQDMITTIGRELAECGFRVPDGR